MRDKTPLAVSTSEAARRLGVTDETVKRYCFGKKLDYFKTPGGHFRVFVESIDRLTGKGENHENGHP